MGRRKHDVRISIKGRDGKTHRIELVELLGGVWIVRVNGKRSTKTPTAKSGQIAKRIGDWIAAQRQF